MIMVITVSLKLYHDLGLKVHKNANTAFFNLTPT